MNFLQILEQYSGCDIRKFAYLYKKGVYSLETALFAKKKFECGKQLAFNSYSAVFTASFSNNLRLWTSIFQKSLKQISSSKHKIFKWIILIFGRMTKNFSGQDAV